MERTGVVAARIQYLHNIKRYREQGPPIIYIDKTFLHSSHTVHRSWQSSETSLKVPFSKGNRLIVVHAHSAAGDYHDEMNGGNFFKWLKEKLVPNLPARSILVVNNVPYHNLQVDKCPTQASRKADIQAWM